MVAVIEKAAKSGTKLIFENKEKRFENCKDVSLLI